MKIISHSSEETHKIAVEFAKSLHGGEIVLLKGELGAGKTVFARAVAESLGYRGVVRSPTFTIMNIYPLHHLFLRELVHLDLYRMNNVHDLSELGLEEWLNRTDNVVMIEWPMEDFSFDKEVTIITFGIVDELTREITIKKPV